MQFAVINVQLRVIQKSETPMLIPFLLRKVISDACLSSDISPKDVAEVFILNNVSVIAFIVLKYWQLYGNIEICIIPITNANTHLNVI